RGAADHGGGPARHALPDRPARPRSAPGPRKQRRERRGTMIPTLDQKLAWLKPAPVSDRTSSERTLGPGEFEIGFQRPRDIREEGMGVFVRPCRSGRGTAGDSLVGIFTADGDMVNGSCGTYLHAVIPPLIIKFILHNYRENPGVRDGDLWFANDAVYG